MDKAKIEKDLQEKPELLKLMQAAATLTPDDLRKVVQFAQTQKRSRRQDDTTPN